MRRLRDHQEGAAAIEYGLIAALIAVACIIAFLALGLDLTTIFTSIADTLSTRLPPAA